MNLETQRFLNDRLAHRNDLLAQASALKAKVGDAIGCLDPLPRISGDDAVAVMKDVEALSDFISARNHDMASVAYGQASRSSGTSASSVGAGGDVIGLTDEEQIVAALKRGNAALATLVAQANTPGAKSLLTLAGTNPEDVRLESQYLALKSRIRNGDHEASIELGKFIKANRPRLNAILQTV